MALNQTTATVIPLHALITCTPMLVPATSTRSTLVFQVHALMEPDQTMITASTPLLALVSRIVGPAMSIKRTSDVLARALMPLNHQLASVMPLPVLITHFLVLAISTKSTLVTVIPLNALELYQTITAIPLLAQVTCTMEYAMTTKRMSEVLVCVLMGLYRPLATVILLPVHFTHMLVPATSTRSMLVATCV